MCDQSITTTSSDVSNCNLPFDTRSLHRFDLSNGQTGHINWTPKMILFRHQELQKGNIEKNKTKPNLCGML